MQLISAEMHGRVSFVHTAPTRARVGNKRQGCWCNVTLQWADAIQQDTGSKRQAMRREKKEIDRRRKEGAAVVIEGSVLFGSSQQVSGKERKAIPVCEEIWKQPQLSNGSKDKYKPANREAPQQQNSICQLTVYVSQSYFMSLISAVEWHFNNEKRFCKI